ADRFADNRCARVQDASDCGGGRGGRSLCSKPIRVAATGAISRDIVHVLDRRAQTGQRAGAAPAQGRGQIMWNESGERSRDRHATPKFSSALALLSEIPIENLGTVPSDHAISTENLFEGPLDMPDPV